MTPSNKQLVPAGAHGWEELEIVHQVRASDGVFDDGLRLPGKIGVYDQR